MMPESAIGVASMSDSGFGVFAQRMEDRWTQHRLNGEYPDHPNTGKVDEPQKNLGLSRGTATDNRRTKGLKGEREPIDQPHCPRYVLEREPIFSYTKPIQACPFRLTYHEVI